MLKYIYDVDSDKDFKVIKLTESKHDSFITYAWLVDRLHPVIILKIGSYTFVSDFYAPNSYERRYYRAYWSGTTLNISIRNESIILDDDERR